jgi:radical SAM protein with 4Fe4S-binding SPASM domain
VRDTNFIDPALSRKSGIINDSLQLVDGWPLPSVVEVSESGTCNRKCVFCPRSAPAYPDVQEFIKPELISKLASELSELNYSGIFLFSGFVEPMLDKKMFNHVKTVRKYLPLARIEMVTNGDVLNMARLKRLFESGLSTILISVYDSAKDAERFNMMCIDAGLDSKQFVIRHRYLPEEQSFGITMNNRAGMMAAATYAIPALREPLKAPCYYPHYTFFMDYLGDVLLCPHDWGKKKILGNMFRQSFREIWLSKIFMGSREMLANANRRMSPCNECDVKGTLMGSSHVASWDAFRSTGSR